ncbi:MAG: Calx-beta domain-containing protein, partial [Chlamydiota bacterium]|nr:Calx-beta domain-containing protein [Chlamydiota bacterium]
NGANAGNAEVLEGNPGDSNFLTFNVALSNASYEDITFQYSTTDGTATLLDNDYTGIGAPFPTVTILAGETMGSFTIDVTGDLKYELDENLTATINVTSGDTANAMDTATGVILNDDDAPTITIVDNNGANAGNAEVLEGNPGDNNVLTFNVALSNASYEDITFQYSTTDGTATLLDNDYTGIGAPFPTVTILAGETMGSFTVDVTGDLKYELDENLTATINVTSGDTANAMDTATGVILNDDDAPTITIIDNNEGNLGDTEVLEGNPGDSNFLTFNVALSNASYEDITFQYSTADGTATLLDNDYTGIGSPFPTVTILAGETMGSFTVDVTGDLKYELDENMSVTINVISGDTDNAMDTAIGVILNDDDAPTIIITDSNGIAPGDSETLEGDPGDNNSLTFNVALSNPSYEDITFQISTTDGTATILDSDYAGLGAPFPTITILAGETMGSFTVDVIGDLKYELDESMNVTITVVSGDTSNGSDTAIGIILNDDDEPTVIITDTNGILPGETLTLEGNPGDNNVLTFTVELSNPSFEDITFEFTTSDGTATLTDNDYIGALSPYPTVTIVAGSTSTTFTIPVVGDSTIEANETVTGSLTVVSGQTSNTSASATGIIINDDVTEPQIVINEDPFERKEEKEFYFNKLPEYKVDYDKAGSLEGFLSEYYWEISFPSILTDLPPIYISNFHHVYIGETREPVIFVSLIAQPNYDINLTIDIKNAEGEVIDTVDFFFEKDKWQDPQTLFLKDYLPYLLEGLLNVDVRPIESDDPDFDKYDHESIIIEKPE